MHSIGQRSNDRLAGCASLYEASATETVTCLLAAKTCYLPPSETAEKGSCKDKIGRWYYHAQHNRCYEYADTKGGCVGNGNNFETNVSCVNKCKLP